ncbi:hypothetical protein FE374_07825 [Georgenia yuyongxinii]|uniref:Uncharacterized protein n=1 Tax=Georgenia yuyongxinii TaxID=2589797 RepID=A0A5B8C1X9_9MICO|nr:hypothetical protein [Georgenia yuyongxinii]QDC24544.1 hypothetical protein FE374_07825 [Georgenia yuyongxinii]
MSTHSQESSEAAGAAETKDAQTAPPEEGGVPNPETGAGIGAGKSSSFEAEEDADTEADR